MTTRWCPECGSEYVEGVEECADCGCALVDQEPSPEDLEHHRPSLHEFDTQFGPDDDVVELCRIPSEFQAEVLAAKLRDLGIPTVLLTQEKGFAYPLVANQGNRFFVRRDDAERAAAVINEAYSDAPLEAPFDELELARLAEESAEPDGWVDPDTGAVV